MKSLLVKRAGPALTIQDMGRCGNLAFGLSRGGAADKRALHEGAALLRQKADLAALEMTGVGGEFVAQGDVRIALTGARMRAKIDGESIAWNSSHLLLNGSVLSIGPAEVGVYGYLHVGGGIDTPMMLGARSAHLGAGIGRLLEDGECLPVGADRTDVVNEVLECDDRFEVHEIRVLRSHQTALFGEETIKRFEQTEFERDIRSNRMGVRMSSIGDGFQTGEGLTVLSEVIVPGDIQIAGDGAPFVLMAECQTTGGYPRIGTVIPSDLSRVAQASLGGRMRFRFVSLEDALAIEEKKRLEIESLRGKVKPRVRNPSDIKDLLGYQLISGVVAGNEDVTK